MEDSRSVLKNGMFARLRNLILEKTRDEPVRRAYKTAALSVNMLRRIHRLNIDFQAAEPRLDDTNSIPELIKKVYTNSSLLPKIDMIARCMIASLFYFELEPVLPQRRKGKYVFAGNVWCSIRRGDAGLRALLEKLLVHRSKFLINDCPIQRTNTLLAKDGNFRMHIQAETAEEFSITLRLGDSEACNISGSPFSVSKLITAQGLDAPFGRPDHRKRKLPNDDAKVIKKRRRT